MMRCFGICFPVQRCASKFGLAWSIVFELRELRRQCTNLPVVSRVAKMSYAGSDAAIRGFGAVVLSVKCTVTVIPLSP
jgi:hypothetical protein